MDYRRLGKSGVKIAPLALGGANFGNPTPARESERIIDRALDASINLIDTSNSYSNGASERIIGETLQKNGKRHQVILATKAFFPTGKGINDSGASRLHLINACHDSLLRLKTDYIDLYQLHRPDPDVPLEETLSALTDLIVAGKIRYIGCSTFPAWGIMEAIMVSELKGYARFISEQPPYNLLDRRIENERVPLCQKYDVGILPWSPMAMGLLAGRYDDAENLPSDSRAAQIGGIYADRVTATSIQAGQRFVQIARKAGIDPAQLAILWVKEQPAITAPIIGPRTLAQLENLLPVLEMSLPEHIGQLCDRISPPGGAIANFHNSAGWMKG